MLITGLTPLSPPQGLVISDWPWSEQMTMLTTSHRKGQRGVVGECRGRGYEGKGAGPGSARARLCAGEVGLRRSSATWARRGGGPRLHIDDKSAKLYSKYSGFFLILCLIRSNICFIVKIKEKRLTGRKTRTRSNSHRLLYSWHLTHLVSEGTFEVFSAKVSLLK